MAYTDPIDPIDALLSAHGLRRTSAERHLARRQGSDGVSYHCDNLLLKFLCIAIDEFLLRLIELIEMQCP